MIVETCIRIIHITKFRNIHNSLMTHLHHREKHGYIICCSEPISIITLQIFLFDQCEQFSVEDSQMADHERRLPISIVFNNCFGIRSWIPKCSLEWQEIAIDDPFILLLKERIKKFENLFAKQLIITVKDNEKLPFFAELVGSSIDIGHGHSPLLIDIDFKFVLRYLMFPSILFNFGPGAILWCIVNENYSVIGVVLLQNRVQVVHVTVLLHIVEAGDENAERQLFIMRDIVFVLVVLVLFNCQCRRRCQVLQLEVGLPF